MDNKNLISVIVPIYNVEEYIDRCISSIVGQTHQKLEIILVDDGSTDNSGKKCDEWEKRDSRIKVIHQKNNGCAIARNRGIDVSSGEYIGFVDGDDFIDANMYEYLLRGMKENKKNFYIRVKDYNDKQQKKEYAYVSKNRDELILEIFGGAGVCWNALYSSKVIKQHNLKFPKDIIYGEDKLFVISYICSERMNVGVLDTELYHYSITNSSINATKDYQKIVDMEKCRFCCVKQCYNLISDELKEKNKIDCIFSDFIFGILKKYQSFPMTKEMMDELKRMRKNFNIKQKIYYNMICLSKNSLYNLNKISNNIIKKSGGRDEKES